MITKHSYYLLYERFQFICARSSLIENIAIFKLLFSYTSPLQLRMKAEKYIIGIVLGYVLKIMKARKKETKFNKEFASIRHGNYPKFINLVNGDIPEMVVSNRGKIEVNPKPKAENIDFLGLIMAGPSMKDFYEKCVSEYGRVFIDNVPSNQPLSNLDWLFTA